MNSTQIVHQAETLPARPADRAGASRLARLAPWLLIGAVIVFYAVTNWIWLTDNVTSTGWDKPRHLARSLNYAAILSQPSIRSLFTVVIGDPVRTPLFPASAAIMYWLFGRSTDVATMVNILYLAVALAATYLIGRRWGGRDLGLIAVALLAFFPMYYAMSRYFYLEFALAGMVALTVYALLRADGFRRRGASLLFGLALGLTLLTKRTAAVFLIGPVLAVVLMEGLLPAAWRRVFGRGQRPRLPLRSVALAVIGGLVPAAVWYWPNRDVVQGLYLGNALFFIWWALAALAVYFLLLPSAPLSNALAALFLAAGLASTWYLARITEFLQRVAVYGYGVDDPRGRKLNLGDVDTYLYYPRKLANEHLSILIFIALAAILVAAVVLYVRRQGSPGRAVRGLKPEAWVALAWIGGGYLLLTLSIYQETRALTPALPAVALIAAAALLKLPRRAASGLLIAVLLFGAVQFAAVTYEPVYRVLTPHRLDVPAWGRTSLLAQGVYIQLPDDGKTDRGYAIYPDVLARMEARRAALGRESLSLGLLVNTQQINAGPFNYIILTDYPRLRVESFIERFNPESPYYELFGQDYLAVKRVNSGMNPVQKELIAGLLDAPPPLFAQAYEPETSYLLPDGDTVYLYRQRYPLPPEYDAQPVYDLAEALGARTRDGDAVLIASPALAGPLASHYAGPADILVAPAAGEEMAALAGRYTRLFVVIGDAPAGEARPAAEAWLNENGFRAAHEWAAGVQLVTYGPPGARPAPAAEAASGAVWGGQIRLAAYDLSASVWRPGDVVPVTLFWEAVQAPAADLQVFVHLTGGDGQVAAQSDSAPGGGGRPTSGWAAGSAVADRHGLLLPDDLPPGEYEVRLGLYLPATGERLDVVGAGGEPLGDSLVLGRLTVEQK